MAWDFKPGMKVVCVDASSHAATKGTRWDDGEAPTEGEVYTIRSVFVADCGQMCVTLDELKRSQMAFSMGYLGYNVRRFRPVRTTDISSLEAHLNKLPARTKTEA